MVGETLGAYVLAQAEGCTDHTELSAHESTYLTELEPEHATSPTVRVSAHLHMRRRLSRQGSNSKRQTVGVSQDTTLQFLDVLYLKKNSQVHALIRKLR